MRERTLVRKFVKIMPTSSGRRGRKAPRHPGDLLRSRPERQDPVFESDGLRVDLEHRRVFREGQEVHLTPTEYKLLATLTEPGVGYRVRSAE